MEFQDGVRQEVYAWLKGGGGSGLGPAERGQVIQQVENEGKSLALCHVCGRISVNSIDFCGFCSDGSGAKATIKVLFSLEQLVKGGLLQTV